MKQIIYITFVLVYFSNGVKAQDWNGIPVPANAGAGKVWQLQSDISDNFNYTFNPTSNVATFGNKWTNFYHNSWEGPGPTIWRRDHTAVSGGVLNIWASRANGEMKSFDADCNGDGTSETWNLPATRAGCITSTRRVKYPVFVEARVKIANAVMASDVWLLSPDDTQEIDILEAYGGKAQRNDWLSRRLHLSHHVFIRNPFLDYQPRDASTWYTRSDVTYWTDAWHRIGVYWKSPTHLEYYVDGQLVKVMDNLDNVNGKDGIDPLNITSPTRQAYNRTGLNKEMDIIINMEDQNWNACQGRTPTNDEITNFDNHNFTVDWIRVYKPVDSPGGPGSSLIIEAESFGATGGTYHDGVVPLGANKAGNIINYVNGGDWMDYNVVIPEDGAYEVVYQYATPADNRTVQFSVSGTPFFTTTLPNTGSWSTYQNQTAGQTANFTAGNHIIRLTGGSADWQWNLDKVILTRKGAMNIRIADYKTSSDPFDMSGVSIYPNPTEGVLHIQGLQEGHQSLSILDPSGKKVLSVTIDVYKGQAQLEVETLRSGVYYLLAAEKEIRFVIE
ncbi:carbohydrate-binding protein [Fulvivirga sp. M361]|uniref:carbohydrate-binding protein n=1 Tax=Fulvivirga sp. M361 TaxID=2594266 RepID=UPI00117A554B|nr:carbohydrate-binding protein [Fulvivirga sp. M361]TRX60173.1 carbohydrate-binding protein [Fulvivirga sp. M361]